MAEKFLSVKEVADKLSLSIYRVRRLIRVAELPGLHDGYKYLIPESELLRWMDAHKIRRQ
jgi:excisionase family DNA binding protein